MADNFLERQRREYEERKVQWLRHKKGLAAQRLNSKGLRPIERRNIERPEDESL